ncbi:GAF domain-containing protein [Mesorhizobium sp. M0910]|uniref:GAF domain-containing protein n=1 Tax=Mesorhizobium sp. M0910 TaxID=2957025 RepID=UPI00333BC4CE
MGPGPGLSEAKDNTYKELPDTVIAYAASPQRDFARNACRVLRNADWRVKVLHLQNLEMIARGETIEATTDRLCHQIEKLLPGVRCSVLRVDGNGLLHPLPGSSFPNEYMALLEGLMIGPLVGSCGSAAYLGKAVAAKDIATDPRWVSFKEPSWRWA